MCRLCSYTVAWIALSVAALQAQDIAAAKFEKSTSTKGGYSVSFPGKPTSQQEKKPSQLGELTMHIDAVLFGKGSAFMVSWNDYPAEIKQQNADMLLKDFRDGTKGEDGTILEDEALKFGSESLPARKFVIKKNGNVFIKNLMVLKDTRLFQVAVMGEESIVKSPVTESKFYKSFTITK